MSYVTAVQALKTLIESVATVQSIDKVLIGQPQKDIPNSWTKFVLIEDAPVNEEKQDLMLQSEYHIDIYIFKRSPATWNETAVIDILTFEEELKQVLFQYQNLSGNTRFLRAWTSERVLIGEGQDRFFRGRVITAVYGTWNAMPNM